MQAPGGQGREGAPNPNAGRGQAPGGRFTDNPRAARNMFLVTAGPGEQRGGPFVGGRKVKVKAGDLLSIPPNTWHLAYGDPGVPLQYTIIHIHTRTTLP